MESDETRRARQHRYRNACRNREGPRHRWIRSQISELHVQQEAVVPKRPFPYRQARASTIGVPEAASRSGRMDPSMPDEPSSRCYVTKQGSCLHTRASPCSPLRELEMVPHDLRLGLVAVCPAWADRGQIPVGKRPDLGKPCLADGRIGADGRHREQSGRRANSRTPRE